MKQTKIKEAQYMYKCRNCGKIIPRCYSGFERSPIYTLIDAIHKVVVNNQSPIPMIETHQCSETTGGIADLVGYQIR